MVDVLSAADHDERQRQINAGRAVSGQVNVVGDFPNIADYDKSFQWEVSLVDLTTKAHFSLSVVANDYVEAGEIGVWAAATERNQQLSNYEIVGVTRQRRIAY
jgi:hypothetical protein